MALLTFFYVIATIALCIASYKSISIAVQLHRDTHRPVIVCDFVVIHYMIFFRIRNIGIVSAHNLLINHEKVNIHKGSTPLADIKQKTETDLAKLYELPDFENGIPFFSPGQEFHYLYHIFSSGSNDVEFPTLRFNMKYSDPSGNNYDDQSQIDLSIYKKEALCRESSDLIVRKLDNICSAIKDSGRFA